MRTLEALVEQAKQLPPRERRRLIETLEDSLVEDESSAPEALGASPYARTLELAGSMHSDFTDVSRDKYKHLADIYGDSHESQK